MKQNEKTRSRQIASNELLTQQGELLTMHVVVMEQGRVTDVFPLRREEPFTEWLQGRIVLRDEDGHTCAYYKGVQLC
ncbi:MAG: hypothetical protein IJ200_01280 [Prevotella sp.]|nr:hypothetical protein [Prevotella sp.]